MEDLSMRQASRTRLDCFDDIEKQIGDLHLLKTGFLNISDGITINIRADLAKQWVHDIEHGAKRKNMTTGMLKHAQTAFWL